MNKTKYSELVKLFSNFRKRQIALFFVCTAEILLNLYFVYQIQEFVDVITSGAGMKQIGESFVEILLIGLAALAVGIWENQMWHVFRHTLMNEMRTKMYQKLLMKKAIFYDEHTTGEVVSAVMNDGSMIAEGAGISILMLFLNSLQVIVILAVLIWKNIMMGVIALAVGAVYFAVVNCVNKSMRDTYKNYSQNIAEVNQHLTEDVKAVLEIKTLNEKPFFNQRFGEHVWGKLFKAAKRLIRLDVISYGVNNFISVIFPVFMVLLGGIFMQRGLITIGTVILYYTYTEKLIEPLNNLADFYRGTQVSVGAADRIYDYLMDEETPDCTIPAKEKVTLEIDIDNFQWKKGERQILNNIHEAYHGGDRIFIEGESGRGKTTLLKLICGFYPITQGRICINGQDVSTLPEAERFGYIKMQFQEPVILEGSLRENIALGNDYSDEEIMQALKMVMLDTFAGEYGLSHSIGEAGKNLSGGQKQRLALARVLIRRPKILILDEATNGLDAATEGQVIHNLLDYVEQTNSILIVTSHKEAIRQICNRKLVL